MDVSFSPELRTARCQQIVNRLNSGKMQFYTNPRPVTGVAVGQAVLLGEVKLSTVSGVVNTGVLTFNPITDDDIADNTGEATWCRFISSSDTFVIDADCGDTMSDALVKLDDVNIIQGGIITVTSASLIEGNI